MATAPFGAVLEAALKEPTQGGKLAVYSGHVVNPRFFCCVSGTSVGVDKDPVSVAIPTALRVCTGAAISVDYSHSWSPSSTIASVQVQWGDGQVSNPAWPGAGTVAHPLGGYVLPGTYTITLITTDLLGATGIDTIQVDAVDCATFATIEMYCSTYQATTSGVWYSNDAGGNWADRGGNVLNDTLVYDLKINPFTIPFMPQSTIDNTEFVELWAATEKGVYKATDGARTGESWKRINSLPDNLEYTAVCPSKFDPLEVYVLANNAPNNQVWLYRTTDGGETWANIELERLAGFYSVEAYGWTHTLDMNAGGRYVYVALIDELLDAQLVRVEYDLSSETNIYDGADTSTWGGIRADYNLTSVVWYFGNFEIAGQCIWYSEDYGTTWEDRSINISDPALWVQHTTEVRPLLMSIYDPRYLIAINNDPAELEVALSGDMGVTWEVQTIVDHTFVNHCGERGWWDDYLIFEGAQIVGGGGEHLELSINLGQTMWTERSGGIDANAPVTSIQILYEHGIL